MRAIVFTHHHKGVLFFGIFIYLHIFVHSNDLKGRLQQTRFKVSFKSSEDSPECAFVVYVDLLKAEVVRNDCTSGIYGQRETFIQYFPFAPGNPFCIAFLCLPHLYKVLHFWEFLILPPLLAIKFWHIFLSWDLLVILSLLDNDVIQYLLLIMVKIIIIN